MCRRRGASAHGASSGPREVKVPFGSPIWGMAQIRQKTRGPQGPRGCNRGLGAMTRPATVTRGGGPGLREDDRAERESRARVAAWADAVVVAVAVDSLEDSGGDHPRACGMIPNTSWWTSSPSPAPRACGDGAQFQRPGPPRPRRGRNRRAFSRRRERLQVG